MPTLNRWQVTPRPPIAVKRAPTELSRFLSLPKRFPLDARREFGRLFLVVLIDCGLPAVSRLFVRDAMCRHVLLEFLGGVTHTLFEKA
jgi:hypothetical protein